MNILPKARTSEIVEQDLGKELLLYDLTTHQAYALNETAKIVFKACDDGRTFDELKCQYNLTDDLIHLALDALKKENLLADATAYVSPFAGRTSRREAFKKVGLATMIALPVIAGITAPTAAHAASAQQRGTQVNGTFCNTAAAGNSQECASRYCTQVTTAGFSNNVCCTQSAASGGRPIDGYFLASFTSDPTVCATAVTARCCTGRGGLDQYGNCYCR